MPASAPFTRLDYALTTGLVLLNVGLKLPYLDAYPLAIDEPISVYLAQFEPRAIVRHLALDTNVPLYDLLLRYWVACSGTGVGAVRLFSLSLYGVSTALFFCLGTRFFGRAVALGATLLFIASNAHAHYAQEARCYALFLLLSLAATYQFFVRLDRANRPASLLPWAALALTYLPLVYTHYFGWFVIGLHGLSAVLFREAAPLRRPLLFVSACTAFGFAPMVYFAMRVFYREVVLDRWWLLPPQSWAEVWKVPNAFLNTPVATALALLVLAAAYAPGRWRRVPLTVYEKVLLLFFPGAFVGMLLVSFVVPMYLDRYLLYTSPALFLLVVRALERLFPKSAHAYLAYAPLLALLSFAHRPVHDRAWPMPRVVRQIRVLQQPGTLVYAVPRWLDLNLAYYYDPAAFRLGPDRTRLDEKLAQSSVFPRMALTWTDSLRLGQARHVLLLQDNRPSAVVPVVQTLMRATQVRRYRLETMHLYEFRR